MVPAVDLRVLPEDDLHIVDAAVAELAPGDCRSGAILARLGIGEIDELVFGKVGIESHVEQPALAFGEDLWHALEWLRFGAVFGHDANPAGSLGDQHAPIWQEDEAPGAVEPAGNRLDLDRPLLRVDRI